MLTTLKDNFAQMSPRTAYAIVILMALLGLSFIFRLNDMVTTAQASKNEAQQRLSQYGQDVSLDEWTARADSARTALATWRLRRWKGETPGFVAAEVQSALRQLATGAEIDVLTLEVDPTPFDVANGQALRFRLSATTRDGEGVPRTMAAFSRQRPLLILDEASANFTNIKYSGRLTVSGYAPIDVVPAQPPTPSGPNQEGDQVRNEQTNRNGADEANQGRGT